jgi:hypothetical protein
MFSKPVFYWRYTLPLLPPLALAAACFWADVAERIARFAHGRAWRVLARPGAALAVLLVFATAEPAAKLLRHNQLLARPSTWLEAWDWMAANVPQDEVVFTEMVPALGFLEEREQRPAVVHTNVEKLRTIQTPFDVRRRVETRPGVAWIVLDSFIERVRAVEVPEVALGDASIVGRIRARLRPVVEFAPGPEGDPNPFFIDHSYSPLRDLWTIERPGTTVRIYRVTPDDWARVIAGL